MKDVLIYGDSNVWGDDFFENKRIPKEHRWPIILEKKLNDFNVISEGLPGRVSGDFDSNKAYKNGKDTFVAIFKSNAPIDYLIIALGTNDLQLKYKQSADDIVKNLKWYKEEVEIMFNDLSDREKYFKNNQFPKIIYNLPPNFIFEETRMIFNELSEEIRQEVILKMREDGTNSYTCFDLNLRMDGIHHTNEDNIVVANGIYDEIIKYEK